MSPPMRATVNRRAELGLQPAGHGDQQHVAELVAEGVVGFGKVVQVDQRQGGVVAGRSGQRGVEDFDQPGAVGQLGELVVKGGVVQVRDQFDIVKADRNVAAEYFQQAFVDFGRRARHSGKATKSRLALPPK
jgi:hypothetical protein